MFGFLSERFQSIFDKLSGRGKLREEDVLEAARSIRLNLLAADVHFRVVKRFVDAVSARAVGADVLQSITPHQQFVKIVHDELVQTLGRETPAFDMAHTPPLVVMCVGLQGSGKTTTAAKLALHLRAQGRRPLLVPADVHRPAAIDQLMVLAECEGLACYPSSAKEKAVKIAKGAIKQATKEVFDTVILDTAGRLHVDDEMMREVKTIADKVQPHHILYVADAMTGQDAATSAAAFDDALAITGVVLTKLDGDARGGAALSIRDVTGKPILFAGVGEKVGDFEPFHPDRMARRILGLGDVVSLVEKVQQEVDRDEMEDMTQAMMKGRFTLEDYGKQLAMMNKLGPAEKLLGMIPGFSQAAGALDSEEVKEQMQQRRAIIQSMTVAERKNPKILNGSRRRRIAGGSGTEVAEVNRLLKEFKRMQEMMRKFSKGGMKKMLRGLTGGMFS